MSQYDYDLLVVGGGSGGVATARRAAEHGARVAICEDQQWGGTCVHRGCVPKKLLIYASGFGNARRLMPAYGWEAPQGPVDWATLKSNMHRELDRLGAFYERILGESGVARLSGTGVLKDAHTVEVGARRYTAERILLAMGGQPHKPPGLEGAELGLTSDDMFWLDRLPQSVLVVGSGYIGTEFAGLLHGLGVTVHQSFGSDRVLPEFDQDIGLTVQAEMEKQGVVFHRNRRPTRLARLANGGVEVTFSQGEAIEVEQVLLATGRTPRTSGMGLEQVGVKLGRQGQVLTDANFQSSVPSVYAIGDCTKRYELTPVAIAEGRALAESLYNNQPLRFSYDRLATAVFSTPPAGTVGCREQQLREKGVGFHIYRARFRPMKYSLPATNAQCMIKLLVDPGTDRILGCHLVSEDAPELIQLMAVVLKAGTTKAMLNSAIAVHPTFAEEIVTLRKPSEIVEGRPDATLDPDQAETIDTLAESKT